MPVQTVRTDASLATLRLYDRSLHPELFVGLDAVDCAFPGGAFRAQITEAGHILVLRIGSFRLTEVVGAFPAEAVPEMGLIAQSKAVSGREVSWTGETVRYSATCHLDAVDAEVFERIDRELTLDARDADLSCRLGSNNRLDPSAVSVVRIEPLDGAISVHTSHTYPSEKTVLRTQSLFELR